MKRVYRVMCRIEMIIAMAGILLMTIFIFLGAVTRAAGRPLAWTTDAGQFTLAWSTFLAGDIAFREGRLANLNVVVSRFPLRLQKAVAVFLYSVIIVFICCLIYFGIQLTLSSRFRTFNGMHGFSYSWVTLCMPVSGVFMLITAVGRLVKLLRSQDPAVVAQM